MSDALLNEFAFQETAHTQAPARPLPTDLAHWVCFRALPGSMWLLQPPFAGAYTLAWEPPRELPPGGTPFCFQSWGSCPGGASLSSQALGGPAEPSGPAFLASISPAYRPASFPKRNPSAGGHLVLALRGRRPLPACFNLYSVCAADANTWVHFSSLNDHRGNEKRKRSLDGFSGREKENCLQVSEGLFLSQQRSDPFLCFMSEHIVRGRQ